MNYQLKVYISQTEDGEWEGYFNDETKFIGKTYDEVMDDVITWKNKTYPQGINIALVHIIT